jgi:hypothetical protein
MGPARGIKLIGFVLVVHWVLLFVLLVRQALQVLLEESAKALARLDRSVQVVPQRLLESGVDGVEKIAHGIDLSGSPRFSANCENFRGEFKLAVQWRCASFKTAVAVCHAAAGALSAHQFPAGFGSYLTHLNVQETLTPVRVGRFFG